MKLSSTLPARPDARTAVVVLEFEDQQLAGYEKALAALGVDLGALRAEKLIVGKKHKVSATLVKSGWFVVAVGLGPRKDFTAEGARQALGLAGKTLLKQERTRAAFLAHPLTKGPFTLAEAGQAVVEGLLLGQHQFDKFRTVEKPERRPLQELVVSGLDGDGATGFRRGFDRGLIVVDSVRQVRDWTSRPNNDLHSEVYAREAVAFLKKAGVKAQVLGRKALTDLGAGAFLAVNQGSSHEAQMVVARHDGGKKGDAPIVLVGKGICFDTGGYSLKLAAEMHRMTDDMAGSAAVIGAIAALARLKVKHNVIAIAGMTDNAIDATAYMPGDIVTSMSGRTIEIISTDAEGRMVLCDCLTYAGRFKPRFVVDVATLTGGCVVALGKTAMGLFSNDEDLCARLQKASEASGERAWRLPIYDEYYEKIKGELADLKNAGDRYASACTAAAFLETFAHDQKWAHLDIAGTCWFGEEAPYVPKGSTGTATRLLVRFVEDAAGNG
ncbi:MAG: leucyl aminopeptidase [Planctomycetes bacterium]|nr:leucyl aminopeptidase [Planctomycetota bacterium]